jgi:transcriptional regulator with XRE-family HTH domain
VLLRCVCGSFRKGTVALSTLQRLFWIRNPDGASPLIKSAGLGERIKELRKARGWTLDQLAKESSLTKGFLSQVEHNKGQPTGRVLLGIARALGASVDWLLTGEDEGPVVETARPVEVPPELADLAVEKGWSARRVFQIVGARSDLLARRSDKRRHPTLTKTEWLEFASRIAPYLDDVD